MNICTPRTGYPPYLAAGAGPGPGQHRQPARGEALDGPQAHPLRLGDVRPRHRRGHCH